MYIWFILFFFVFILYKLLSSFGGGLFLWKVVNEIGVIMLFYLNVYN